MMRIGQKWHCVNPRCCAELVVTVSSRLVDVKKPRCECGDVMKREYEKPMLRKVVTSAKECHDGIPGNETAGS